MKQRCWSLLLITSFGLLPGTAKAGDGGTKPFYDSAPRLFGRPLADGALGYAPNAYLGSVSIWRLWHAEWIKTSGCYAGDRDPGKSRVRFSFGAGLRLTQIGHPGNVGFAGRGPATGQTLTVRGGSLSALNVAVRVRWRLTQFGSYAHPLHVGFNIDLAGFTIGPQCPAALQPTDVVAQARPTAANLLFINTKDRGTLNSEFYVAYKVAQRLGIRAGLAHVATGYSLNGARYQRFSNVPFIGISYCPGKRWRDE